MKRRRSLTVAAVLTLVVSACGSAATPTLAPVATPTLAGSVAMATPTARPLSQVTPTPAAKPTAAPTVAVPKVKGTLRNPTRAEPPTWDAISLPSNYAQLTVLRTPVFTPLFTRWSEKPGHCRPETYGAAAKSWRWVNETTFEVTLKEGIRFQNKPPVNGREVTAEDFVQSFKRYRNWGVMAPKSEVVESVTAKDKYMFQMKLVQPWGGLFPELLTDYNNAPWLEPVELAGLTAAEREQPEKSWIGSGPFMFQSFTAGVKTRLVRNPDFWIKGRPYLEAAEFLIIPDASTRLAALSSGKINFIDDIAEEFIEVLERSTPGLKVARCPGLQKRDTGILWMNNTGPPFNDARVRRAAQMAIDQQAIIDKLYKGKGMAIPVLPPALEYAMSFEDFPPEVRQYMVYNPEGARKLLAEAGYPNGFDSAINFTNRYAAPSPMVAEAVADMLSKVGIRTKLLMHEYTRYVTLVIQRNPAYPVGEMAITIRGAISPDGPHAFLTFWSKAPISNNRGLVNDPEYDKLYEEFRFSVDEKRRTELARQMQIMIASKAYAVRLPFSDSVAVGLPGLHFTWIGNTSDFGMLAETAWFE